MWHWIDTALHPERYHGHGKHPPFFEGWYYKLVSASETARLAIIPGIFLSDAPDKHHAFVQVFDGARGHATYHAYPASDFRASNDALDIRIGPNHFTRDCISLHIADDTRVLRGEVNFSGLNEWPVTLASPGIMGPFGWLPFMECYHGVVSLDHAVSGRLVMDRQTLDFDGGRGYTEKDWGQSFPSAWVWMQSNHFSRAGICLTASTAIIPFLTTSFPGFIVGLLLDDTLHRFTTYAGGSVERLRVDDRAVEWALKNRTHRIEIYAQRADGAPLPAPDRIEMGRRVLETMNAEVEVRLSALNGQVIFHEMGRCGGLEVMGDLSELVK